MKNDKVVTSTNTSQNPEGKRPSLLSKKRILMIGIALSLLFSVSAVYAATIPSGTSGTITVTAPPGLQITGASIGGTACTVSGGGTSFTCGGATISIGQIEIIKVNVTNPAFVQQSIPTPAFLYSSSGTSSSAFLSTGGSGSNPNTIGAGLNVTLQFNSAAIAVGSDSLTITI